MRLRVKVNRHWEVHNVIPIHCEGDLQRGDTLLQWDAFLKLWRVIMINGITEDHYSLRGVRGDLATFTWNEVKEQVYNSCLRIVTQG